MPLSRVLILLGAWLGLVLPALAGQVYTVAVVPQRTPVDIGLRWTPLLNRLERETGEGFQLRVVDRFPAFERDFMAGIPDFAFLNPYYQVMAARAQGYVPLVRSGMPLTGKLVVDNKGPIQRLADLDGKTIAFPAPNVFAASLYLRALLTEQERLHFKPAYVGSHQNVYRSVVMGDYSAGGGADVTLMRENAALKSRLRVLYSTPPVAAHPLAAHPRVHREVRERIVAALLRMAADPEGRKLLADVDLGQVELADYARDYAPLERLRLDRYLVIEKS